MASKVEIKWKALSVANKLYIIKKVDTQPHVTQISLPDVPVLTVNNILANKNDILQQGESSKPSRNQKF
jgi:hypothetical protein